MTQRYQTILLFGAPGSGKGTQGKILGSVPGFFHLSCGEVFRSLDHSSELGRIFREYSSRGALVPDDATIGMWHANMQAQTVLSRFKPRQDLLVLDGIPRNVAQAKLLRKHLNVLLVVHLVCPDKEKMFDRLRRRALKENRIDDAKDEVIRQRWKVYEAETYPVLEYYPPQVVREVNAMGSPARVLQHVLEIVVPIQESHFSNPVTGERETPENGMVPAPQRSRPARPQVPANGSHSSARKRR